MSNSDDLSTRITGIEPWDPPEGEPGRGMTMHTTRGDVRLRRYERGSTGASSTQAITATLIRTTKEPSTASSSAKTS